ncbi:hypothetical protein ECP02989426_5095 [Escherichia coli P0298942.6]|nr:hypothetical protein EC2845350_1797 [Escherichia coli 2845350]ENA18416.1 hypothetical protein ECP02989421_2191 [Escherichia coli P0298942.1]ENB50452.1 hypothetical protein ECP029894212_5118 [Escherichia coli P0298942.12]ENB53091.1 hypothetical protein ECP029894211_5375 [Escherichia coli P0298942.11]ENB69394.1 hypothetical protein ECP029894215_5157 [Escherichia coli P0298942.15]ENB69481.1 hypothetical protein ECP02989426_5095 [Escherichia coli P0298942.6]ENB73310.1 hypothetical protein ECP0
MSAKNHQTRSCPDRRSLVFIAGNNATGRVETCVFLCAPV